MLCVRKSFAKKIPYVILVGDATGGRGTIERRLKALEIRELLTHVPVWDGQLAAWRRDERIDFIVAFFHECAFSTCGGHSSDGGVRSRLAPLFSRHQVDLVIQGHNHVYERTNPLIYDAATNSARSSKQAVAISPGEPAEVEPANDGTTYVVAGTAGTLRYDWTGTVETDRNFVAGAGSGATVVGDAATRTGPYVSQLDFGQTSETVDWSQARYADYGFVALDVTPAPRGQRTTMVLRYISEQGTELDRVVFSRTAGAQASVRSDQRNPLSSCPAPGRSRAGLSSTAGTCPSG